MMTVPTSDPMAASNTVRAMSNVWARRLMAGTVNPETSPRPRAAYSSWMLADRAPSSWLASQTSHWAAAGGGLVGREGRGPREVTDAVAAEASLVVDDQAVAVEVGHRLDGLEEVGRGSRDVGHGRVS